MDTLVRDFIWSDDAALSERVLGELLSSHAEPQIRRVLSHRLIFAGMGEQQDLDDLCAEVLSELLYRLRRMRAERNTDAIQNFSSYTSVTAYRAYSDYLRRKYPQRHRLKTQLRYLFHSDRRFSIWEIEYTWLCGLAGQADAQRTLRKVPTLEEIQQLPGRLPRGLSSARPGDFIAKVLACLGGPIELNDLVGIVAGLWGIQDQATEEWNETDPARVNEPTAANSVENKDWLARLWHELRDLPLAQRHALLLNLRDDQGGSALMLAPMAGIASIRQIADVLEMAEAELASLWNRLPIDDLMIAQRLGLTRQQVINLRKAARARLTRRMAAL